MPPVPPGPAGGQLRGLPAMHRRGQRRGTQLLPERGGRACRRRAAAGSGAEHRHQLWERTESGGGTEMRKAVVRNYRFLPRTLQPSSQLLPVRDFGSVAVAEAVLVVL